MRNLLLITSSSTMMTGRLLTLLTFALVVLVKAVTGDEAFTVNLLTLVPFTFE